jgi:hypothetical protein
MDWYNDNVEEPIREVVKLLRDNGFNTECSCGHDMYVQCQFIPDGELQELHKLLYNYLFSKSLPITYEIKTEISVVEGNVTTSMMIHFEKRMLTRDEFTKISTSALKSNKHDGYERWLASFNGTP